MGKQGGPVGHWLSCTCRVVT